MTKETEHTSDNIVINPFVQNDKRCSSNRITQIIQKPLPGRVGVKLKSRRNESRITKTSAKSSADCLNDICMWSDKYVKSIWFSAVIVTFALLLPPIGALLITIYRRGWLKHVLSLFVPALLTGLYSVMIALAVYEPSVFSGWYDKPVLTIEQNSNTTLESNDD